MNCNEIDNRLPAYLEYLLSPEEQKSIAGHLASCPHCSRALADLKETERLLRGLEEVEPPPFFEQRIMARVREEAGRKQGILRRLFYPLHIKVPIQALATLLVAVLAFYVYQTGDPEMKQMAPLPIPLTELAKGQFTAESPRPPVSPSAIAPVKRAPVGDLPEKDQQRFAAPPSENVGKAERTADSRAPMREERPAAVKSAAPVMAAREKAVPPVGAEALSKAQDRTGKQDADQALETLLPEQKGKEKIADTGAAAGESQKAISAPSQSRMTAGAAIKRSVMDLTIQVGDTAAAIREIEARLGQVNARIIERQHLKGSEFLKVEVPARNAAAFLDLLETMGRVNLETNPLAVPDEDVTIGIKIISRP
jgi:anti-sigma factor RsiW